MNKNEREIMGHLYDCINRITGMYPNNPANSKAKFKYLDQINKASRSLLWGLSSLNCEDYEEALENMLEAKEELGLSDGN